MFFIGAILSKLGSDKKNLLVFVQAKPISSVFTINLTDEGISEQEWLSMSKWKKQLVMERILKRDFENSKWIINSYQDEQRK